MIGRCKDCKFFEDFAGSTKCLKQIINETQNYDWKYKTVSSHAWCQIKLFEEKEKE